MKPFVVVVNVVNVFRWTSLPQTQYHSVFSRESIVKKFGERQNGLLFRKYVKVINFEMIIYHGI